MADASSPQRDSLYPEPLRHGDWNPFEPEPERSHWWVWYVAITLIVAALAGWLGTLIGTAAGTSTSYVLPAAGAEINSVQAQIGTCMSELPEGGRAARIEAVPCSTAHRAEVVATYEFLEVEWPGEESVRDQMLAYCGSVIQPSESAGAAFKPADWADGLRWVVWAPTEATWADGGRTGSCVVTVDADVFGSFARGDAQWQR